MGLYEQMEDEIIADIARRVKKTGRYTETAELMAKSMVEQGYSAEKIQAEVMKIIRADKAYQMAVAENTKAYKQEVQDIIKRTVKEAKEAGDELTAEAGNMAWNNDLSMWQEHGADLKKPNSMSQLISAFQKQTAGQLRNLTNSTGFKNTVFSTTGVLNAYQREMDLALLKVSTGTFSYDQAVNDCVHRLAQSGLRSIDYANGRSYQLDTAVRMSVRTGLSQLSGKVMEANLESSGQDLVITSQHIGSRPEHVPWQNKVFSYSGKNKKYPDFFRSTGYGTATGLKGVNCTHEFYPFWEGADFVPDDIEEPKPVKINGKTYNYYQVTQKQRQMERNIRATKREIEAQRAIGGDAAKLQSKLRKQTADYRKFSAAAGVKVKENRLRVIHGTSAKTKSPKKSSKVNKNVALNRDGKEISFNFDKMFDSGKKHFNLERETKKSNDIKEKITVLSNQYNTYLTGVKVGGSTIHAAGYVDIDGMMILSNSKPQTFLHEFAHSIASHDRVKLGLASESEIAFEKELAKLFSEYKDVVNGNPKKGIKGDYRKSISAYSLQDKEEFFAEAFAHYKMREFGYDMSKVIEYGNDYTYSSKVVDLVDKYFKKTPFENSAKRGKISMNLQHFAKIPEEKFIDYALNPIKSPEKAKAFQDALGYNSDNCDDLIKNIKEHIDESKFIEKGDNGYGMRYEYVMNITGSNGKSANVLTAWIQDGEEKRLTSVYVTNKKVTE